MTVATTIESHRTMFKTKLVDLCRGCWSKITIKFNWAWIIFFAFFLAYGYYGALSPAYTAYKTDLVASFGQLILLGGMQVVFGYVAWKKSERFKDAITFSVHDVLVYISFTLICLAFSHERLQHSLFSDEISYSGSAHGHSIYFALALAKHLPELGAVKAQYLVQTISLTLLASLAGLICFSACWTPKVRIAVFLLLLLAARMVFALKGGMAHPTHPYICCLFLSAAP